MTPGERYLKALAARTPPTTHHRPARSFAEIEEATHWRPAGKISQAGAPTITDLYGRTVKGSTQQ